MALEPTPPTPATPPAPVPVTHPNPNLYPTPDRGGPPPPKTTSGCTKAALFGCGGVVLLIAIIGLVGMNWVRGFIAEFEENPGLATVKTMARLSPEFEWVETDSDAGTATLRHKETGQDFTVHLDKIEQGQLNITTGEGSFDFNFDAEGGRFDGTTGDGTTNFTLGSSSADLPDWFRSIVPEDWPQGQSIISARSNGSSRGIMVWQLPGTTPDAAAEALAARLREQGFEVETNTLGVGAQGAIILAAEHNEGPRKVQAQFSTRDKDAVHVNLGYEGIPTP